MNSRERFVRVLTGQDVDRVPFIKVFGGDDYVLPRWEIESPGIRQGFDRLMRFEGKSRGWAETPVNFWLSNRGEMKLEESGEDTIERWDDGQAFLHRAHDFHRHQIAWPVKDRNDWDRVKERNLNPNDPERFPAGWQDLVDAYRVRDYPLQLTHSGVYGFCRFVMGDQALAYAFYDDPELVHDIMDTYTDRITVLWEKMARDVQFDLIECWEDMASKNGCLISPAMYRTFLKPNYLKIKAFADAHKIPIILIDSDGLVEGMLDLMLECGINATYPMEVQSGNDTAKVRAEHPNLGMIGGLNKESMAYGKDAIDAEVERARQLIALGRFIPGPDHFVLSNVSLENYMYFYRRLRDVVMTTLPGTRNTH